MADLPDFTNWPVEAIKAWLAQNWPGGGGGTATPPAQTGAPASPSLTGGGGFQLPGAGAPTISQPATQKWTLLDHPTKEQLKAGLALRDAAIARGEAWPEALPGQVYMPPNPNYTQPASATSNAVTTAGGPDVGWFAVERGKNPGDPIKTTPIVPPHTPNADEEIDKALTRYQNEALRNQRITNEQNGFGYADDDTVAKRSLEARAAGVADKDIAYKFATLDQTKKNQDQIAAREDKVAAANIGLTGAQTVQAGATTAKTGVETQQLLQNMGIEQAKLPSYLAQAGATLAGTEASTAASQQATATSKQAMQIAGAPQVQTPPTGMSQWTRDPITGAVTQGAMNPEYQAKTPAEVAARAGQIQQIANAKKTELLGKVSETYTTDQAARDFNSWYDQNVQPQLGALQAAQQAALAEQNRLQMNARTSAQTTATGAGQLGLNAFQQLREAHPITQTTQDVMAQIRSGKPYKDINTQGAFTWQGPNPIDLAQQQTQQALKYIDPTAAQANGLPPPNLQGIDINAMLGRQNYMPAGAGTGMPDWLSGAAPPPPPAPAPEAAPAPTGMLPPGVAGTAADPRFSGMYGPPPYPYGG